MTSPQQPPPPPELADEELTPLEQAFYVLFLAALTAWLGRVASKVLATGVPDPMAIFSTVPFWSDKVRQLTTWLRIRVMAEGTDRLRSELPGITIPNLKPTDQGVQEHLAQVGNFLVRLPDEVFDMMREQLAQGQQAGESTPELAARIRGVLDVTGSENWPSRAKTVAITETVSASNSGWYASAIQAQRELGITLWKEWIGELDRRIRPEHRAADGQRVPLLSPFIVGGVAMPYPGWKGAPPHLVINCRCTAATKEAPK